MFLCICSTRYTGGTLRTMRSITWLNSLNRRRQPEPFTGRFHRLALRLLWFCFPDFDRRSRLTTGQPLTLRLGRDGIIQLEEHCGARCLQVRRGTVWLTGTPAESDVMLQTGNRFSLTGQWPFVLQAMGDVEIDLLP